MRSFQPSEAEEAEAEGDGEGGDEEASRAF